MIRASKKRKKIRRQTKKQRAKKDRDLELKQEIHERDGGQCVVPTKFRNHGGPLQAAHVYSKGRWPELRHVADNLLSMCWSHHFFWQHKNPIDFTDWWRVTYPEREVYLRKLMQMDKNAIRAELKTNDFKGE